MQGCANLCAPRNTGWSGAGQRGLKAQECCRGSGPASSRSFLLAAGHLLALAWAFLIFWLPGSMENWQSGHKALRNLFFYPDSFDFVGEEDDAWQKSYYIDQRGDNVGGKNLHNDIGNADQKCIPMGVDKMWKDLHCCCERRETHHIKSTRCCQLYRSFVLRVFCCKRFDRVVEKELIAFL